jgi:DNA mismatch repair protein MutL
VVVELSLTQANRLSTRMNELVEAGFRCEQFGGRSFVIRAAPRLIRQEAMVESLAEALDGSEEGWLERLLIGLACRSAVRKGSKLPLEEQEALVQALPVTESPTVCPHGSPLLLHLTDAFLRRQFGW